MTTGTTSAELTGPPAARRRPGTGLAYLVMAGLLWGTGGLTGSLLSRSAGLPALSVAAYRLGVGGALILAFLVLTSRRRGASGAGHPGGPPGPASPLSACWPRCSRAATSGPCR